MSWVAAGVSIGTSVFGGIMGSKSEKKAAAQRAAAIKAATEQQTASYRESQEFLEPRAQQEQAAMGRVTNLLGLDGEAPDFSTFTDSPGYEFQREQGQQAIERSAAARGGLQSGNTLAAAAEYGQGLADSTFQNYLAQVMQLQNQGVDTNQANLATNYGVNVGNLLTGAGEARASGTVGSTNALVGGLKSASDAFSGAWGSRGPAPKVTG
jgi:hypothetical protein